MGASQGWRRAATVLVWTSAMLIGLPAGAGASPAPDTSDTAGGRCPVVEVTEGPDGMTAPESARPGLRTFRLTATEPGGVILGLFRLNAGVQLDGFVDLLRIALTGHGAEQVEAGRAVAGQSTLLGGINTVPGRPATFTQSVTPGTYHLINYADILAGPQTPLSIRPLRITGPVRHCVPPRPQATIEMLETAAGPRFRAPATLRTSAAVLVSNRTEHVEEAVLTPIRADVTDADLQRFFEALDSGQPPPDNPFIGPPSGMPVIHPRHAIIEPNLAPGRYALITWLPDADGHLQAARGMHAVITVE